MPIIPSRSYEKITTEAWADFRTGWKLSKKGNLWRNYEGKTLSVFKREGDAYYAWSIADNEGVRYSQGAFGTQQAALTNLGETVLDF
jgi:hypothetical protein